MSAKSRRQTRIFPRHDLGNDLVMSARALSPFSRSLTARITVQPHFASVLAVSFPTPLFPPVTIACLPHKSTARMLSGGDMSSRRPPTTAATMPTAAAVVGLIRPAEGGEGENKQIRGGECAGELTWGMNQDAWGRHQDRVERGWRRSTRERENGTRKRRE